MVIALLLFEFSVFFVKNQISKGSKARQEFIRACQQEFPTS